MKTPAWQRKAGQDPKGGLNAAGRAAYNRATGGNLLPPVGGTPRNSTEMRRKGSFLVRMGSSPGPLFKDGEKTRLKLSLEAWGHDGDKGSAVERGRRLLEAAKRANAKR